MAWCGRHLYGDPVMTLHPAREATRILFRGVIAGGVATAAMTAAYTAERRTRRLTRGVEAMDYDDGVVPGQIVLHLLHLPDLGASEETTAGLMLRWSYGSAFEWPRPPPEAAARAMGHRGFRVRFDGDDADDVPAAGSHPTAVEMDAAAAGHLRRYPSCLCHGRRHRR